MLCAAAGSCDLVAPAASLTPAVWSGWLQVSECLVSQLVEMHSKMCGGELGRGQLCQEHVSEVAQSWPDAASCQSYSWAAVARYSTVLLLLLVPCSMVMWANVDTPFASWECLLFSLRAMNALTPFGEQRMMSKAWRGQLSYYATTGLPAVRLVSPRACRSGKANDYQLFGWSVMCIGADYSFSLFDSGVSCYFVQWKG